MEPRKELIACVVRQYTSGLYRTCVSLDRNNTVCLGTHQDEASATKTINQFLETYRDGKIKTLEDILLYLNSICDKDQASEMAA
jgi:hypothetical protein